MVRQVPLTRGLFAIVSDKDYRRVSRFNWHASLQGGHWYGQRSATLRGRRVNIKLHRFILRAPRRLAVTFKNNDGLDCRRSNMRICRHAKSLLKASVRRDSNQPFKGVRWEPHVSFWSARIRVDGVQRRLGLYHDPVSAARAYNHAAREAWGTFAHLNPVEKR